jgi:hypothetical protein
LSDEKNVNDVTEKLPDGLEGQNVPDNFFIPSCGIEDVDLALFDLFDKKVKFTISQGNEVRSVPVIFAGGERFALVKRKKPIRDKNGTFILPLISIARTSIDQSEDLGGLGRGIGQDVGDLVIKTRLDASDRRYQSIKNKLNLNNQVNVASQENETSRSTDVDGVTVGKLGTRRKVGRERASLSRGEVLRDSLKDNIVEVITIPYPEFFSAKYEVVIWTQYQQHMNRLLEQMMSAYHAQGNQFRIDSPKGYWFVAFIDDSLTAGDNFEDYSDEERIVKYSFTISTTGYLVAAQHEGMRSPFRKFVSAPEINFGVQQLPAGLEAPRSWGAGTGDPNKFILSDIKELDPSGEPQITRNHSQYGRVELIEDPFTGEKERRFLRVKTRNQRKGETVISANSMPTGVDNYGTLINIDEITS